MANQINTRILLKYDSFQNWESKNPTLLAGEVAIAKLVTGTQVDASKDTTSTAPVLFKVGPGAFNSLPWVSGLAADVYAWAKKATPDWTDFPALPLEVVDNGTGKFVTDFTYADNKLTITRSDVAWSDVTGRVDGVKAVLKDEYTIEPSVAPDGIVMGFSVDYVSAAGISTAELDVGAQGISVTGGDIYVFGKDSKIAINNKKVATEEYVANQLNAIDYDAKLADAGIGVQRSGKDAANPGEVYQVIVPSLVANEGIQVRKNGDLKKVATEEYVDAKVGNLSNVDVDATTKPTDVVGAINKVREELEAAIDAGGTGSVVTVEKLATATDGSLATYVVKQNNAQVGDKIEVVVDSDLTGRVDSVYDFLGDIDNALENGVDLQNYLDNVDMNNTVSVETAEGDEETTYTFSQGLQTGGGYSRELASISVVDAYKKSEADAKFTTPAQVLSTVDKALADVASTDTISGITTLVEYVNEHGSDLAAITNEIYGKDSIDTTGESRIDKAISDSANAVSVAGTASSTASGAAATAGEAKQIAEGAASTANDAKSAAVTAQNSASASASAAAESASNAAIEATIASNASARAEGYAGNASVSAGEASTAQGKAEIAQAAAETAQGKAEAAQAAAEASNTSATAIANEAKQAADAATQASNTATQTVSNLKALAFKDKVTPTDLSEDVFVFYCGTASILVD